MRPKLHLNRRGPLSHLGKIAGDSGRMTDRGEMTGKCPIVTYRLPAVASASERHVSLLLGDAKTVHPRWELSKEMGTAT